MILRKIWVILTIGFGILIFPLGLFELGFMLGLMKAKKMNIIEPKKVQSIEDKVSKSDKTQNDGVIEI